MEPTNNITQETLELIERYINHKLTDLELSAFEDKLKNNPDFKNQVDDIKIMFGFMVVIILKNFEILGLELRKWITPINFLLQMSKNFV